MKFLAFLVVVVADMAIAHAEPSGLGLGGVGIVPQIAPIPTVITAVRPAVAIAPGHGIIGSPIIGGKLRGELGLLG